MTSVTPATCGADDHPACRRCGGEMLLYRRGPHPRRTLFEVQRFECRDCKSQSARTAAKSGR